MALNTEKLLEAIRVETSDANTRAATRMLEAVTAFLKKQGFTVPIKRSDPPGVPDSVFEQAVIQMCGYLWEQPASAPARMNFANAMQNSGASALLAPWKTHRAGVIGGDS